MGPHPPRAEAQEWVPASGPNLEARERPAPADADRIYITDRIIAGNPSGFNHLEVVGRIKGIQLMLPMSRKIDYRVDDPLFMSLGQNTKEALRSVAGPYYLCVGDQASVQKSILKMDFEPASVFRNDPYWRIAVENIIDIYSRVWTWSTRCSSPEEVMATLNVDSSPGVPLTQAGFRHKADVLDDPWGRSYLFMRGLFIVVWRLVDKHEWYHVTDLQNGKVRTFIIPPFKFLLLQKRLFYTQNESMKEFHWSAYGFNPYNGGVNRLVMRLKKNPIYFMYDVSGWDRLFPVMEEVYEIRLRFFSPEDLPLAQWVAEKTRCSLILLPDGTLILKKIGNNSGSNNTTSDNILGHTLIQEYNLLKLFAGDEDLVDQCVVSLFGDDDVGSMPDIGLTDDEIKEHFISVFSEFNFVLNPIVITRDISQLEFLGFGFKCIDGFWYPQYKIDRLVAAFCYEIDKGMDTAAQISKAYSLMVMAWPTQHPVLEQMKAAYSHYCLVLRDSTDPIVRSYIDQGVPTDEEIDNFYTGRECSIVSDLFRMDLVVQKGYTSKYGNESRDTRRKAPESTGQQRSFNREGKGLVDSRY